MASGIAPAASSAMAGSRSMIGSLHRLKANLLGLQAEEIHGDGRVIGDADQYERSAQARHRQRGVDGFGRARGVDGDVHAAPARFIGDQLPELRDRARRSCAQILRHADAMRQLVGHEHCVCARFARHRRGQQTDGARRPGRPTVSARANLDQFQHVHDHCHRLDERCLRVAEALREPASRCALG